MKKRLVCSILAILMIFFAGCDPYSMVSHYPYEKADKWICEETDFTFAFTYEDGRLNTEQSSVLRWNGEEYNVYVLFQVGYFRVDINENGYVDESRFPDGKMLTGTWEYRDNKLIMSITEDYLYEGKFQELSFVPQ